MVSHNPSVRETGRDRSAKRKHQKTRAFSYQFPILDFLLLITILRREMAPAQVIKCVNNLCEPAMSAPPTTIISRLNSLTCEGFLLCRQESIGRHLHFGITDKGKDWLLELCKQVPVLSELARAAISELTDHILASRRPRPRLSPGSTVERP